MLEAIRSSSEIMSQLAGGNPPLHEAVRWTFTRHLANSVWCSSRHQQWVRYCTSCVLCTRAAFVIGFPDVDRSGDTDRMSQLMREMHTAREADAASRRQVNCCPRAPQAFWSQLSWSLPTL